MDHWREYSSPVTKDLKHHEVRRMTRAELEEAFWSDDPEKIRRALLSATYYDQDWRWVQEQCLHFLTFPEVWVRRNAATCLGLLAVFRKKLDFARILPALERAA